MRCLRSLHSSTTGLLRRGLPSGPILAGLCARVAETATRANARNCFILCCLSVLFLGSQFLGVSKTSFISRGGNTGSGRSRIWTDFTFDSSLRTSSPQQSPPPSSKESAEEGAGYARSSFLVALNTPLTSCQTAVTLKYVGTAAAVAVLCPGDQLTSARNRFGKIGMLLGKDVRSVMCVSAP